MRNVKWNLVSCVLGLLLAACGAEAATFTVTNLNDSGTGSLRQAVLDANGAAGADTIVFQAGLTGTITLASGQLALTDAVTIAGPGANLLTVSGNNASRVFQINAGVTAAVSGLTIADGYAGTNNGGGIYNLGALTLTGCAVKNNQTSLFSTAMGGGVYCETQAALTVSDSLFTGNVSYLGSAIHVQYVPAAQAVLTNVTVSGNTSRGATAGAIVANGPLASIRLESCTVTGNSFPGSSDNGAVNAAGSQASIQYRNTIVSGNSSPQFRQFSAVR